jgi:hypothetical protein
MSEWNWRAVEKVDEESDGYSGQNAAESVHNLGAKVFQLFSRRLRVAQSPGSDEGALHNKRTSEEGKQTSFPPTHRGDGRE